jgi:hypothetical protein
MKDTQTRVARRNFLAGAGVVAAAAGTAALTARGPAAPAPVTAVPDVTPGESRGYRVSDHVRKYYRSTLV